MWACDSEDGLLEPHAYVRANRVYRAYQSLTPAIEELRKDQSVYPADAQRYL